MPVPIRYSVYWALFAFLLSAQPAGAESLPSAADSSRLLDSDSAAHRATATLKPRETQISRSPDLPPELRDRQIFLKHIAVVGNTSLPQDRFDRIYGHLLNTKVTVGTIFDVIAQIQQSYLDEGYALTRVFLPQQDVEDGKVTIRIVEGYVESVEFTDDVVQDNLTADFVARVYVMRPLNTLVLERLMLLLNDRPGVRVAAVLAKPAADADDSTQLGAIRLILKTLPQTEDKSFISFDNYGSGYTGSGYFQIGTRFDRLGENAADIAVNIGAATSLQELRQAGVSFSTPLYGLSGWNLECGANANLTTPGEELDELDIKGRSVSFYADITYPFIRQRDRNFVGGLRFAVKNTRTNIADDRLYEDRVRSLELHTAYDFVDSSRGYNHLQFALSKGLNLMRARESGAQDLSREEGRSDFTKVNISLSRLQNFSSELQLFAQFEGQYAPHPLLSSEEFGFGGGGIGRGYDPSEITGDRGWAAKAELRYNHNIPEFGALAQPYIFLDTGKLWNIDGSITTVESATSSGIGVRYADNNNLSVDFNVSYPLTRAADNPPDYANGKNLRPLLKISKKF